MSDQTMPLREQIARAIAEADEALASSEYTIPYDDMTEEQREPYQRFGDAALDIMTAQPRPDMAEINAQLGELIRSARSYGQAQYNPPKGINGPEAGEVRAQWITRLEEWHESIRELRTQILALFEQQRQPTQTRQKMAEIEEAIEQLIEAVAEVLDSKDGNGDVPFSTHHKMVVAKHGLYDLISRAIVPPDHVAVPVDMLARALSRKSGGEPYFVARDALRALLPEQEVK